MKKKNDLKGIAEQKTRKCVECGSEFTPNAVNHVTCSDDCIKKRHARQAKERCKKGLSSNNFICPRCGCKHNSPADIGGHKYQYCRNCREGFYKHGWPADEFETACNRGW